MEEVLLKQIIKKAAISSIVNYFDSSIRGIERKFQILDLLMPKERLIRSIVGGLETSMGKTLWEPLAKEIANNNGFTVVNKNLEAPSNMPASLSNILHNIIESREKGTGIYNAQESHIAIKHICQQFIANPLGNFQKAPRGFGVDIWLEKNGVNYFFDTKTVQPNVGSYHKFLSQVLNWYAYFYAQYPTGLAEGRIVFPYNPHSDVFWQKTMGGGKPLEKITEAWVEDEFWDFLSGYSGTFRLIKLSFKEIHDEGTLEAQLDKVFDRNKPDINISPDEV